MFKKNELPKVDLIDSLIKKLWVLSSSFRIFSRLVTLKWSQKSLKTFHFIWHFHNWYTHHSCQNHSCVCHHVSVCFQLFVTVICSLWKCTIKYSFLTTSFGSICTSNGALNILLDSVAYCFPTWRNKGIVAHLKWKKISHLLVVHILGKHSLRQEEATFKVKTRLVL